MRGKNETELDDPKNTMPSAEIKCRMYGPGCHNRHKDQLPESLRTERGLPRTTSSSAWHGCRTTWRRGLWCSATFQRLRTGRCRSSTCSGRRSGPWEACVSQIEAGSSWLCSWEQAHSWEPADGLACSVLLNNAVSVRCAIMDQSREAFGLVLTTSMLQHICESWIEPLYRNDILGLYVCGDCLLLDYAV